MARTLWLDKLKGTCAVKELIKVVPGLSRKRMEIKRPSEAARTWGDEFDSRCGAFSLDSLQLKRECQGMMKLIEGALPPSPALQGGGLCSKGHEYDSTYWLSKRGGTAGLQPS